MDNKNNDNFFVITYRDPTQDKNISLKAKNIIDSSLGLSFVRVSDFVFETDSLVVKPDEEALKKRFEDVKSLHLSIYTIISIEEIAENTPASNLVTINPIWLYYLERKKLNRKDLNRKNLDK